MKKYIFPPIINDTLRILPGVGPKTEDKIIRYYTAFDNKEDYLLYRKTQRASAGR